MEGIYSKAYKEVTEILKYVPKESIDKIPKEMLEMFEAKMDRTYNFEIDINKDFEEQELLDETKAIFANIFRDYWANPYQKEKIEAKEKYDRQKAEEEKYKKYNLDDLYKKKTIAEEQKEEINSGSSDNLPYVIKEENIWRKIINFFKKMFIRE